MTVRQIVCIFLLTTAVPAVGQIAVSPETPVEGQPVALSFSQPVDTLTIVYRPGSTTSTTETLALHGDMSTTWTPTRAGVVRLAPNDQGAQNVSVRFQKTPGLGIFIMIAAGMILFGGIGFALRSMLRDGNELTEEPFLGDT